MIRKLCVAAIVVPLFACQTMTYVEPAPNFTQAASSQTVGRPAPDKARVVFMRTSNVGVTLDCHIFEVVGGELRYVGQLYNGTKLVHDTTPGEKVYMARSLAADFMYANVDVGKTYYSIVRPNFATSGFAPSPIRRNNPSSVEMSSKQFQTWEANTKLVEVAGAANAWFERNKKSLQTVYADYWARFMKKTDAEKRERTLRAEDGI